MIKGFKITCEHCGSEDVHIEYKPETRTTWTYQHSVVDVLCYDCHSEYDVVNKSYLRSSYVSGSDKK